MRRVQCFLLDPTGEERTRELEGGGAIHDSLYRRVGTDEVMTIKDAPPGAMFRAPWYTWITSQDAGAPLCVKLPNGWQWCIDEQAANCTMKDDARQQRHHCWIRHGQPPDVTVDKQGSPTCAAGAGSIVAEDYHGFLRNGWLED